MPYRELYRQTPEQSEPDSPEIATAIEHHNRFGHLDPSLLWPASKDQPFKAERMHSFAVSADGKRAILCSYKTAWLLDTKEMRCLAKTTLPSYCRVAALSSDGNIAALVCDDATLYRWGLDSPGLESVWQSAGLADANILELSADGTIAVTSRYSTTATVRVFNFAAKTLVYSFHADSDECLALHPSGRHILCFGDNGYATIYGPRGNSAPIENTTGGAFSPDGKSLCVNDTEKPDFCFFYSVVADDPSLQLGKLYHRKCTATLARWDFQARYAPDGRSVLLATHNSKICHLDIASKACKIYNVPLERKTSITADNNCFLTGPLSRRSIGIDADGIALVQVPSEKYLGLLWAASGEPETLVGLTVSGFYGSAETSDPLGDEHAWPYERSALTQQLLSQQKPEISDDEVLLFEEITARRLAWKSYTRYLVADLGDRELVEFNQGIIELTPEIVHRALTAAAGEPCFGKPQLTQHTIQAVSEELKALSPEGKRAAFAAMLVRLREPLQPKAAAKTDSWLDDDWLD